MMTRLKFKVLTDIGQKRALNEDSYVAVIPSHIPDFPVDGVFLVADGMGGHSSGEVASKAVADYFQYLFDGKYKNFAQKHGLATIEELLEKVIKDINLSLYNIVMEDEHEKDEEKGTMGTTLTAGIISYNKLYSAQVGDSRLYLIRENKITQLTKDQTLVNEQLNQGIITKAEAEKSTYKNILSQAIGPNETVNPDIQCHELQNEDILVFCTDGLYRHLSLNDIFEMTDPQDIDNSCKDMIELANDRGGKDNITVIVVKVIIPSPIIGEG